MDDGVEIILEQNSQRLIPFDFSARCHVGHVSVA